MQVSITITSATGDFTSALERIQKELESGYLRGFADCGAENYVYETSDTK